MLERAALSGELHLFTADGADAATQLHREWLPTARALVLSDTEAYFLELDDTPLACISPRNESAALALLLDALRADEHGACARCV